MQKHICDCGNEHELDDYDALTFAEQWRRALSCPGCGSSKESGAIVCSSCWIGISHDGSREFQGFKDFDGTLEEWLAKIGA